MRLLGSLLGLEPYAARGVLFVDPHLPEWLPDFTLERLRVGDATVTLRFRRAADGHVEHEVLARDGKLSVCRAERIGARLQTADAPDAVAESAAAER
jgi:hypothetical protein